MPVLVSTSLPPATQPNTTLIVGLTLGVALQLAILAMILIVQRQRSAGKRLIKTKVREPLLEEMGDTLKEICQKSSDGLRIELPEGVSSIDSKAQAIYDDWAKEMAAAERTSRDREEGARRAHHHANLQEIELQEKRDDGARNSHHYQPKASLFPVQGRDLQELVPHSSSSSDSQAPSPHDGVPRLPSLEKILRRNGVEDNFEIESIVEHLKARLEILKDTVDPERKCQIV